MCKVSRTPPRLNFNSPDSSPLRSFIPFSTPQDRLKPMSPTTLFLTGRRLSLDGTTSTISSKTGLRLNLSLDGCSSFQNRLLDGSGSSLASACSSFNKSSSVMSSVQSQQTPFTFNKRPFGLTPLSDIFPKRNSNSMPIKKAKIVSNFHKPLKVSKSKKKFKQTNLKTPRPKAILYRPFGLQFSNLSTPIQRTPIKKVKKHRILRLKKINVFPKITMRYPKRKPIFKRTASVLNLHINLFSGAPPTERLKYRKLDIKVEQISVIDVTNLLISQNDLMCNIESDEAPVEINGPFVIVDSRFEYEFDGGHFKGAYNLPLLEQIEQLASNHQRLDESTIQSYIFHCERSICRGPRAAQYFRHLCIKNNMFNVRVFVMTGGYSCFWRKFQNHEYLLDKLVEPQFYVSEHAKNFALQRREQRSRIQGSWKQWTLDFDRDIDSKDACFELSDDDLKCLQTALRT